MDIFIKELKLLLSSVVIKRNKLADVNETLDMTKEAGMYLMVTEGMDDFTSYVNFDREVYVAAGVSDLLISEYMGDKSKIPYGLRDAIVKLERQYILSNYVEKNNYYRMLNGLPDYTDTDFVYVPTNEYEISTTIPIHQLDTTNMARLMNSGMLTSIIAANPTKKYLNYIGDYSITIYKSRKALNYELLYCTTTDPDNITADFKKFYTNAREYYLNAIYNTNLANTYTYYDNFIGFCIIIMSIQRLCANIFKQGITRDFYDTQLIRYLFDSYNIPYIDDMTMDQMKIMAKNLNIFLSMKSTTKVLFDLCSIFGFSNINIYKYLLVRDHVMDSVTGKPIFPTKTTANGDGTFTTDLDYATMYNVYFQKVNVETTDLATALEDKTNKVDYASMVANDIYWVDDDALREKIYTAKFNHIESKYISMDIMFKITAMMYEICHTFRMIIDNHSEFSKVSISVPKISSKQQDLFTLIIFLCATFCKRFGFTGEIPLKPASIAFVYGFNFNADLTKIITDIYASKYIDSSVVKYLINFTVNSSKDVDRIYSNIKTLKDFIVEQMASTKDINVYRAYEALYKSVLVVQDKDTIYKKTDGTLAASYIDMLKDLSPELYTFLEDLDMADDKNTVALMESVLYKLEDLSSSYKYLHTAVESNALFTVLIRLVKLFKSYTVDLTSAGILYLFDDRYFNMFKVLDAIHAIDTNMYVSDKIKAIYLDMISTMSITIPEEDKIVILDKIKYLVKSYAKEKINLTDDYFITSNMQVKSKFMSQYADDFNFDVNIPEDEKLALYDKMTNIVIRSFGNELIGLKDSVVSVLANTDITTRMMLNTNYLTLVDKETDSNISMDVRFSTEVVHDFVTSSLIVKCMGYIMDKIYKTTKMNATDFIYGEVNVPVEDKLVMRDSVSVIDTE